MGVIKGDAIPICPGLTVLHITFWSATTPKVMFIGGI